MKHFDELELLDAFYLPDSAPEQMQHVGQCGECAARFAALSRELRQSAAELDAHLDAKPETFWTRQRLAIVRDLDGGARRAQVAAWRRFAVAASFFAVLGTALLVHPRPQVTHAPAPVTRTVTAATPRDAAAVDVVAASDDPWQSDELSAYHDVVQWESWSDDSRKGGS